MWRILLAIFILFITLSANAQEVQGQFDEQGLRPKDGNALLDYCGKLVSLIDDSKQSRSNSDLMEIGWCTGYVQGTVEPMLLMQVSMTGDSSNTKKGPMGICIPFEVPTTQVARVFVKWLRDHPEKLHENITGLTIRILHDAFPCAEPQALKKESPK